MDKSTSRPQDFPFPRDSAKTLDSGQKSLPFSEDYPSIVSIRYELITSSMGSGVVNTTSVREIKNLFVLLVVVESSLS